jgi:hypothetical protein
MAPSSLHLFLETKCFLLAEHIELLLFGLYFLPCDTPTIDHNSQLIVVLLNTHKAADNTSVFCFKIVLHLQIHLWYYLILCHI